MSLEIYNTTTETEMEEQNEKQTYTESEKFKIGCKAMAGVPVEELSKESGMSRAYIYQQKLKIETYAESLDEMKTEEKTIKISKIFITRVILVLMLYCRSPLEGVQRAMAELLGVNRSIGFISGVINEAAVTARAFDDSINLDGIRQGANDEIFQGGTPVLTGADAQTSFIYLLEEASNRTGETWEVYMEDRKDHGLNLAVTINDGGAGLKAGISKVFPDADIQRDVFHAKYEMGKQVSKVERKAYANIKEEYELRACMEGKRPSQKAKEKLEQITPKEEETIKIYDKIDILYTWFKELLGFSGYGFEDTTVLVEYILTEMEEITADYPGLRNECKAVRKCLPSLLSYINRLEIAMEKSALVLKTPVEAFHLMYKQLTFGMINWANQNQGNQKFTETENQLASMLMDKYDLVRGEFQKILKDTKKASSLVENLNGRIRDYMDIKRTIPTNFFPLLKVYFNTKRYRRSRCPERVGKSPLELLTGTTHPDFLEILGY